MSQASLSHQLRHFSAAKSHRLWWGKGGDVFPPRPKSSWVVSILVGGGGNFVPPPPTICRNPSLMRERRGVVFTHPISQFASTPFKDRSSILMKSRNRRLRRSLKRRLRPSLRRRRRSRSAKRKSRLSGRRRNRRRSTARSARKNGRSCRLRCYGLSSNHLAYRSSNGP